MVESRCSSCKLQILVKMQAVYIVLHSWFKKETRHCILHSNQLLWKWFNKFSVLAIVFLLMADYLKVLRVTLASLCSCNYGIWLWSLSWMCRDPANVEPGGGKWVSYLNREKKLDSLVGPRPRAPPAPKGLYIYGNVGSGLLLFLS